VPNPVHNRGGKRSSRDARMAVRGTGEQHDSQQAERHEGDDNIVEVYIGYVRRKVDAPFGTTSIDTVRGVGYPMPWEA